ILGSSARASYCAAAYSALITLRSVAHCNMLLTTCLHVGRLVPAARPDPAINAHSLAAHCRISSGGMVTSDVGGAGSGSTCEGGGCNSGVIDVPLSRERASASARSRFSRSNSYLRLRLMTAKPTIVATNATPIKTTPRKPRKNSCCTRSGERCGGGGSLSGDG